MRLLAVVCVLLTVAGCKMFERGDLPEPPPANAPQGMAPGWHEIRPETRADVDRICRMLGVSANDDWNPHTIAACAPPSIHAVILPADGVRDDAWLKAARAHEYAHTWGLRHPEGGHGWINPFAQAQTSQTATTSNPFAR